MLPRIRSSFLLLTVPRKMGEDITLMGVLTSFIVVTIMLLDSQKPLEIFLSLASVQMQIF